MQVFGLIAFLFFISEYGIDVRDLDDDDGNPIRILERLTLCSFTDTSEKMLAFKDLMR